MKKVLYITYDGLTDPLGQSQILPYIKGLSNEYSFTILSCEKKERFEKGKALIEKICSENGILWEYIFFKSKPPVIAKYLDLFELKKRAGVLQRQSGFELIHCRSYVSIEIGLELKKKFGVKVLFDMRGFWVDERVEGGIWNLRNPIYRYAYKVYKQKEARFIKLADHIISLTEAGRKEIQQWDSYKQEVPITVIPCMVDFKVFNHVYSVTKEEAKKELGFQKEELVLSYLGSLGTWYLLDEMLRFFVRLKQAYPSAKFLFITPDKPEDILEKAVKMGLQANDFTIMFTPRAEVPKKIKASDVSLVFIKRCYSKIASSPTKLGELMALGIPVVCNHGIGDVDEIIASSKGGVILKDFSDEEMDRTIQQLPSLLGISSAVIAESIRPYYDLTGGVETYRSVYKTLIGARHT